MEIMITTQEVELFCVDYLTVKPRFALNFPIRLLSNLTLTHPRQLDYSDL